MDHPQRRIDVDDGVAGLAESGLGHRVSSAAVAVNFFDVLDTPILSGRGFHRGDLGSNHDVVIVNESFVHQVLGGRNPIGRRVRYPDPEDPDESRSVRQPGPWYEIVGMVRDLGMTDGSDPNESGAGLYHPVAPGAGYPVQMAVHVKGERESLGARLRGLAAAVDPAVRLYALQPLDEIPRGQLRTIEFWFGLLILVSSVALILSLAGIYSVMSFTVSRRTHEIGIRVALGADAGRIVAAIFTRALTQVGLGLIAGGGLVLMLTRLITGLSAREVGTVGAYMVLMMGVCMLACIVPTWRALRVEPTAALRADA